MQADKIITDPTLRRRASLSATGHVLAVLFWLAFSCSGWGQTDTQTASDIEKLKSLPFEALLTVDVTTATKQPQLLTQSASAIQVITSEDIRRSGATSLPEALRLAPNLMVAQVDSRQWAISSRGFTSSAAD